MDRRTIEIAVDMGIESAGVADDSARAEMTAIIMRSIDMALRMEERYEKMHTKEIPVIGTKEKVRVQVADLPMAEVSEMDLDQIDGGTQRLGTDVVQDDNSHALELARPRILPGDLKVSSLRTPATAKRTEKPWQLPELLSELHRITPPKIVIEVKLEEGDSRKITLERNILAEPALTGGGGAKLMYRHPMYTDLIAAHFFAINDPRQAGDGANARQLPRDLNIAGVMNEIREIALQVYRPRPAVLASATPLDGRESAAAFGAMLSDLQRNPTARRGVAQDDNTHDMNEALRENNSLKSSGLRT